MALTWVARGFSVVPCSKKDKAALVPGFGRDADAAQLAPFSDPAQVWAWWSGRYRRDHVGLLTGRGADGRGLAVIDLDVRKAGVDLPAGYEYAHSGADILERLAADAGEPWPDTYTVLTPSGGIHLYFQQPADGPLIGCATGAGPTAPHLGPLIDVRGIGGYVIAAGSYSAAQGIAYRRVSDPGVRPQPLPEWLLARLRRPAPVRETRRPATVHQLPAGDKAERYAASALRRLCEEISTAPDGERWHTVQRAALRLAELAPTAPRVLTYETVRAALEDAAEASGMSGGAKRARRTLDMVWAKIAGGAA